MTLVYRRRPVALDEYESLMRNTAESLTMVGERATFVDVHGAKTKESLLPEFLAMQCFEVANVANPPSQQKGMSSNKPPANKVPQPRKSRRNRMANVVKEVPKDKKRRTW